MGRHGVKTYDAVLRVENEREKEGKRERGTKKRLF
jgi:hypothetical protein